MIAEHSRALPQFLGQVFDAIEHLIARRLEDRPLGEMDAIGVGGI
jgi:hypothetical protein